jgi:hypothetical protein
MSPTFGRLALFLGMNPYIECVEGRVGRAAQEAEAEHIPQHEHRPLERTSRSSSNKAAIETESTSSASSQR